MQRRRNGLERLTASVFRVPTDYPEADGTFEWNSTTLVVCEADAEGMRGIGYTYSHQSAAKLIETTLTDAVTGFSPMDVPRGWAAMLRAVRNLGSSGIAATAISAVDVALWDLKAKLLDVPLVALLGASRDAVEVYGSGGFTSYPLGRLSEQLAGWVGQGIPRVKMKIGTHPEDDLTRVAAAREAVGTDAELFVDANGAYARKQALAFGKKMAQLGVTWFEEPVPSDDLDGLRLIRDQGPAGMEIAAGEYGYDLAYFQRMLRAGAVDVLQADATRCLGITGFLKAGALAQSFGLPLSAHCAPALHLHVGCAVPNLRHLEYFHDHVRIERMLFDGVAPPRDGKLSPDLSRPGLGLSLREADAQRYAA